VRAPRSVAAIWVHGATSRFYAPASVQIGRELARAGYTFVIGNNRGHHLGTHLLRRVGPLAGGDQILGGTLWERFEDSPSDVGAWVTFTMTLGVQSVALIGLLKSRSTGLSGDTFAAPAERDRARDIRTAPRRGTRLRRQPLSAAEDAVRVAMNVLLGG
jgi:hypothetical protein